MNRNEDNMFDELMRQKLGEYQEEPDMKLLANIHARKNRFMRFYGISKLIILLGILGLGLLAGYFVFNNYSVKALDSANRGSVDVSYQTSSATFDGTQQNGLSKSDRHTVNGSEGSASVITTPPSSQNNNVTNSPAQNKQQASTPQGTSTFTKKDQTPVRSANTNNNRNTSASDAQKNNGKELKQPATKENPSAVTSPASAEQQKDQQQQTAPVENEKEVTGKNEQPKDQVSATEEKSASAEEEKKETAEETKDEKEKEGKDNTIVSCHAKFDYFANYDGGFKFVNMSEMNVTSSVKWDFGDGRYSEEFTPSHKFTKSGVYTVVLQVINKENKCESFYEKEVRYVANSNKIYPYIKGVVTSSGSSARQHNVKLLMFDMNSGKYVFSQSASTNNSGEYEFIDVKAGVYKIVADAKSDKEITTYFGNTDEMEEASEINLFDEETDELLGYNINLKENETTAQNGDGRVWDTTNSSGLIVLDGNNMPVANVSTDASGKIIGADGLPPGDYTVVDKSTGMIKGGLKVPSTGEATITPPSDMPGSAFSPKVTISPNPASAGVKFFVSGPQASDQVTVVLISAGGAEMLRRTYAGSTDAAMYQFDVSNFPAGVYYVIVTKDGKTTSTRLVKSLDK